MGGGNTATKNNTLHRFNTITAFIQNYCDIESEKGQKLLSVKPIPRPHRHEIQTFMICCTVNDDFKNLL